jgi:phosphatidylglycerophosphatase C
VANIVVFDLDRTITRMGTYTPFLLFYTKKEAPWRLVFAPFIILAMIGYKLKLLTRSHLKTFMFLLLVGKVERNTMDRVAKAFAKQTLENDCFGDAATAISQHLKAGDTLILATASFAFYAKMIATRLGFHHCIGSPLKSDEKYYYPSMPGPNCYGQAKADYIEQFLAANDLQQDIHTFYTDDKSDMPTVERAKFKILVNPKTKFRQLAQPLENVTIHEWS